MSLWTQSAVENILPLSISNDLKSALAEWYYTGEVADLEQNGQSCQLCNHPNIRYKFEIFNKETDKYLYVGSECIKKFGLSAIDEDGKILNTEETKKLVNRDRRSIEKHARDKRVINSILNLSEETDMIPFEKFVDYYSDNGAFTPKQLGLLVWQFEVNDIEFKITDFKIKIRKDKDKKQLAEMPEWKVKKIWGCMTKTQREYYENNK